MVQTRSGKKYNNNIIPKSKPISYKEVEPFICFTRIAWLDKMSLLDITNEKIINEIRTLYYMYSHNRNENGYFPWCVYTAHRNMASTVSPSTLIKLMLF